MRVLYLSQGRTVHDFRFLDSLVAAGCAVGHVTWSPQAVVTDDRPGPAGVTRFESRPRARDLVERLGRLRAAVREFRPDIVHAGPVPGPAFWVALLGYRPLVSMSWGSDLLWDARRGIHRWKARFALRRTSAFVGDCEAVRRAALQLGMRPDRIEIFPWGVDLETFSPGPTGPWRARAGWQNDFVILCTRSFEPRYGVNLLLEAFLELAHEGIDMKLILVGSGSQEESLRRQVQRAAAEDRVHFAGQMSHVDLPGWYRSADLFVSPSHSDGSSVSLLEALASGLPAVVSDIPSNREWVEPGENGWWFRDGDSTSLAAVLRESQSSTRRPAMRARSRAIAQARADWSRNFPKLMHAYAWALEGGRSRP